MRTIEEIIELRSVCESWQGTPFCPNSNVRGAGVCCHKFCGSAYMEAGWLPAFEMPDGYPYGSAGNTSSPFESWLDASVFFDRVENIEEMEAGDIVLAKPSRLPWHLSIFLGDGWFSHVDMRQGVQVTNSFPDVWKKRITAIYRPRKGII